MESTEILTLIGKYLTEADGTIGSVTNIGLDHMTHAPQTYLQSLYLYEFLLFFSQLDQK
jgi:hypothetical protein